MSDLNDFEEKFFPDPSLPSAALTVTPEEVRDVLAHTEVLETPTVDFVLSPGQVWLVQKGKWVDTHEIEVPEETFWELVLFCLGEAAMHELKRDVDDVLRWEGEGGSCLS